MAFTVTTDFSSGVNTSFSTELNDNFQDIVDELNGATTNNTVMAPIGSIVAWLPDLSGTPSTLPAGWVECDGSTISDASSPYDGVTIPDLNGSSYFLKGSGTSGNTSSETHTHTGFATNGSLNPVTVQAGASHYKLRDSGGGNVDRDAGTTGAASVNVIQNTSIVANYSVVWIMRIK